jgi:hypothetical protein
MSNRFAEFSEAYIKYVDDCLMIYIVRFDINFNG